MTKQLASYFVLLIGMALGHHTFGQGYRIEAVLKGIKDTTCILGHYSSYGDNQFIAKDTAKVDTKGRMVFEGDKQLPGGLYLILLPGKSNWVQLIVSGKESDFSIEADTADLIKSIKVKGSRENQIFYDFQREIGDIVKKMEALNLEKKAKTDPAASAAVSKKIQEQQTKFKSYREDFLTKNAGTFTVELLKQSIEPEIPKAPLLPNGKQDSSWVFNYYKSHYWSNFDFSDERLLKTPFLRPKLERYIHQLVVQQTDSIIKDADALIKKASVNKEMKSFFIYYITNDYEMTKIVGTEGVFVHMAEKYYLTGEMGISEDAKKKVKEKVTSMKPLLVNKIIPDLVLSDTSKKPISIHGIKADYTVLVFYSPSCGHCKESAPKLKEFYDKNKATGVKVLAIATEQSPEEWKKFIQTYKLEELLHGYDYNSKVNYYRDYDVVSTPTIYVLDKNKKIIARKMPVEQLDDFYNFYRKKK
jgi:thiol-disulfide isomerase/thioredoxin